MSDSSPGAAPPSFLIAGVGAVGGWLLGRLSAGGADVTAWLRGEALARARAGEAFRLRSIQGDWSGPVRCVEAPDHAYDVTLVATKSAQTAAVSAALPVGAGVVVSAQNGVDNAEVLRRRHPRVAPAVVRAGVARTGPLEVRHTSNGYLLLDDADAVAALRRHGVDARRVPDVRVEQWSKLMVNCVINGLCAVLRRPVGAVRVPALRPTLRAILGEVEAVARAEGVALPADVAAANEAFIGRLPGENRPSTLQDLEAGRPLEVDALTGAVVRRAAAGGVPVPTVAAVDGLLRALDPASGDPVSSDA